VEKIVIEHVKASELPESWTRSLKSKRDKTFTVTLLPEQSPKQLGLAGKPNQTFGMWADRNELQDVAAYVRKLRQSRY
jgi:hypothetical protein